MVTPPGLQVHLLQLPRQRQCNSDPSTLEGGIMVISGLFVFLGLGFPRWLGDRTAKAR